MENFKSIHIDLEKGVYEINGKSIKGGPIAKLNLEFDNGYWQLKYEIKLFGIEINVTPNIDEVVAHGIKSAFTNFVKGGD